jgi:F-box-like
VPECLTTKNLLKVSKFSSFFLVVLQFTRLLIFTAAPELKKQKLSEASDENITLQNADMLNSDQTSSRPDLKLPDEVLEQIFKFLDRKELLNSLMINSSWKRVVEKTSKIMEKFALTVDLQDEAQHQVLKKSQRCYQEIKVTDVECKIPIELIEILTKIGANVKTLNYSKGGANFISLLDCFRKIETIVMNKVCFSGSNINAFEVTQFPSVKTLMLIEFDFCTPFFSMFSKVQHLHMSQTHPGIVFPGVTDDFVKAVTRQLKHVETLTLTGLSQTSSEYLGFLEDLEAFPYVNVSFNSGNFDFVNRGGFENLRNLTVKSKSRFDSLRFDSFIAECPKLETIDIEFRCHQRLFNFSKLVSSARNGMTLTMRGYFRLTPAYLQHFKENSLCGVRLQIPKASLMMTEEVFEEIMGEDKQRVELI